MTNTQTPLDPPPPSKATTNKLPPLANHTQGTTTTTATATATATATSSSSSPSPSHSSLSKKSKKGQANKALASEVSSADDKKLSPQAMEALAGRLSKAKEVRQETEPLLPPIRKSREQLQDQVNRLYTLALQQRQANYEKLLAAQQPPQPQHSAPPVGSDSSTNGKGTTTTAATAATTTTTSQLNRRQVQDLGERLCTNKATFLAKLREKYYSSVYTPAHKSVSLPQARLEEAASRMYEGAVARRAAAAEALWQKYVVATERPVHTLSPAQLQLMADRLSSKKS